jgi:hypothetical protein
LSRKSLRDQGVAVNPNTELYFQDVGLRTFTFTFKLMARNLLDSDAIMQIVKTFEYAAHPEKKNEVLYAYPDECILTFLDNKDGDISNYKSIVNNNLPAINRCVIKSFSHTYNSDSNVFFENGMPSSVDISITFQETSVNTRETINRSQDDTERRQFSSRKDPKGDGLNLDGKGIITGVQGGIQEVQDALNKNSKIITSGISQNDELGSISNLKPWGIKL